MKACVISALIVPPETVFRDSPISWIFTFLNVFGNMLQRASFVIHRYPLISFTPFILTRFFLLLDCHPWGWQHGCPLLVGLQTLAGSLQLAGDWAHVLRVEDPWLDSSCSTSSRCTSPTFQSSGNSHKGISRWLLEVCRRGISEIPCFSDCNILRPTWIWASIPSNTLRDNRNAVFPGIT